MAEKSQKRHDTRTLIMMRHAEADWELDDYNRQLTQRGHLQAQQAGQWLVESGNLPEMIVSSAALRTRQTTTWVCQALGEKAPTASLDERLYNAPESSLMERLITAPAAVRSLMLIAHQPGIQELALRLMRPDSDYEASVEISYGFPPASVAIFEVQQNWHMLAERQAQLKAFKTFEQ